MKIRIIQILIIGLSCTAAMSQVKDPNATPFAYGPGLGAFVCFANPHQPNLKNLDKNPVGGFSIGGMVSLRKAKYFFETGLDFRSEGYGYSSAITANNTTSIQKNEYKFYSIMLPLKIAFPVSGRYTRHLPSLALNFSYALRQTQLQTIESENAPYIKNVYNVESDYNKITPSFTIAYGIEYDLDLINAIRFEPTFQFSFINAKSGDNKTTINNAGLRVYFLFLR